MGCLEVTFERVGEMTCSFGLVCGSNLEGDEVLWASDQMVLVVDGGKIYLTKKN